MEWLLRYLGSQTEAGVGAGDVVEEFLGVFTHDGFLVVAGDVVPCDAVVVYVVENAHARLVGAVDVEFSVVGLTLLLVAGLRPWVVAPAVGDLELKEHTYNFGFFSRVQRLPWCGVSHGFGCR